ncbi:MAG: copper chaperone [Pedobacter sp.]|nr:MAG: copper chaperone [Pedobacter sp.]
MDILVFKTNLRYKKNISEAVSHIENIPGVSRWNVDLKDRDKVLRIEASNLAPKLVEETLTSIGYYCKELE